jgi:hypothetical protein
MTTQNDASTSDDPTPRPYWIPPGVDFDRLPEQLRAAILGIINPAYQELVLRAQDGQEKAAGVTVVSLLWLEILGQIELAEHLTDPGSVVTSSPEREQLISRHLRVAGAMIKASGFLLRLSEFKEKYGHLPGARPAWARPIETPGSFPEPAEEE